MNEKEVLLRVSQKDSVQIKIVSLPFEACLYHACELMPDLDSVSYPNRTGGPEPIATGVQTAKALDL